jgi:Mg-chelatase subunit ChlD
VTITVTGTNDAPVISVSTGNVGNANDTVYESGLSAGSHLGVSNVITASGQFIVSDAEGLSGDTISFSDTGVGGTTTSFAVPVSAGAISGKSFTTSNGTVSITNYDGVGTFDYTYTLNSAASAASGNSSNGFKVTVGDGVASASQVVTINIVDDAPHAYDNLIAVAEGSSNQTGSNLLFILDYSGSMNTGGLTALKSAVHDVLTAYDQQGGFKVQLVTFGVGSSAAPTVYSSVSDVDTYLNSIKTTNGTNYEVALSTAQTAWNNANIAGASPSNSTAYFISDGTPNAGNAVNQQSNWESYVTSHFSKAIAIGINTDSVGGGGTGSASDTDLQLVAYTPGGADEIYQVADLTTLTSTLVGTISVSNQGGNVITDGTSGNIDIFGADGSPASDKIVSIAYDADGDPSTANVIYTSNSSGYNSGTNTLTITTHIGGTLAINCIPTFI